MRVFRKTGRFAIVVALMATSASASVKVGGPAPDFRATTFDGRKIDLAAFRGDVLIVNIWATWCGPCKRELPLLDRFYQLMKKNGLSVVAVTTEDSLPSSSLKPLQGALAIPLARSFRGAYAPIGGAVPTNFVIDRAGVVRYAKAGAFDLDTLNTVLVPLLNEPRPAS